MFLHLITFLAQESFPPYLSDNYVGLSCTVLYILILCFFFCISFKIFSEIHGFICPNNRCSQSAVVLSLSLFTATSVIVFWANLLHLNLLQSAKILNFNKNGEHLILIEEQQILRLSQNNWLLISIKNRLFWFSSGNHYFWIDRTIIV